MPKVLLTNFYFERYTGSELYILELGRLFEQQGYDVTIAVYKKAYPLLNEAGSLKIIECLNEELDDTFFDIIFVQHFPVFDYICCRYEITCEKLIVSQISAISEMEQLPACASIADMIVCVSEECAAIVRGYLKNNENIRVFPNSVSDEFITAFEGGGRERDFLNKSKPDKIAVISNHISAEVLSLSVLLRENSTVDLIGAEYNPILVDARLLQRYDLVITIGRTVQQCFAVGVPVYVYDCFGGPGYINDDNFEMAEKNNFSGRGDFGRYENIEDLEKDIKLNYKEALHNIVKLHNIAKVKYSYSHNFNKIYEELINKSVEKKTIHFAGLDGSRLLMYSKHLATACLPSYLSQLFIDQGEGFSETNSISWNFMEGYVIKRRIQISGPIKHLRFDPCNAPCICTIMDFSINGISHTQMLGNRTFISFDPQYIVKLSKNERIAETLLIEFSYKIKILNMQDIIDFYGQAGKAQTRQVYQEHFTLKQLTKNIKLLLHCSK